MTVEQFNRYLALYKNGVVGDELKSVIQSDAIDIWLRAGGKGVIEAFTGFGKSFLTRGLISRFRTKMQDKVNIVVPTRPLYDDFKKNVKDFDNCEVSVINSYVKEKHECGLLIVDEVHKSANRLSENHKNVIPHTKFNYCLGLTATLNDTQRKYLESIGIPVVFTITRNEANKLGLLPEFDVFNYGIELTTREQLQYQKAYEIFNSTFEIFKLASEHNAFDVAMACCQKPDVIFNIGKKTKVVKDVLRIVAKTNELDESDVRKIAFQWKASMIKLGQICDNAYNKKQAILELLDRYKDEKTIVFSQSIDKCEEIANEITNAYAYHSKTKQRKKLLDAFISGFFGRLITVEAIDMGLDDSKLTLGINAKYDNETGVMVQRIGRFVRNDKDNPDKYARFINLYCKPFVTENDKGEEYEINTVDYNKLKNLSYNEPYVWIDDLNET